MVVLGLGCEVNQIGGLMQEQKLAGRLRELEIQSMGGTRKTVEAGVAFVREALTDANKVKARAGAGQRTDGGLAVRRLRRLLRRLGQSALGAASDLLVRHGGTVILSETPETYGAEHLLTRRAVSREVGEEAGGADALVGRLHRARRRRDECQPEPRQQGRRPRHDPGEIAGRHGQGGLDRLVDVVNYAEAVTKKGFVFMDTPGYDPVAATGQVAGGANLVCFTTGRGSVFGCKPSPSIKLATNTPMYKRMEDDMDVNCGTILDGDESRAAVRPADLRADVAEARSHPASRPRTKASISARAEFAPWVLGATM